MRIFHRTNRSVLPPGPYPLVALRRGDWDDYGFKTTFEVTLYLSATEAHDLDEVKILHRFQTEGPTPLPPGIVAELGDAYCSLGQSLTYYEQLRSLGEGVYRPFLEAMRDAAFSEPIRDEFEAQEGFQNSLIRFDAASHALEEAPVLLGLRQPPIAPIGMEFEYAFPGAAPAARFLFNVSGEMPGRFVVVVGYNGSGKTRLLANLARLTYTDREESRSQDVVEEAGFFIGARPQFNSVVAVSYSAFDTFALPSTGHRSSSRSYVYCGLRRVADSEHRGPDDDVEPYTDGLGRAALKDINELDAEFHEARDRAQGIGRGRLLSRATEILFREPSFQTTVSLPEIDAPAALWREAFARLSSGHKIALNITVQLSAYLQPRSLVLFDEPELHLHPPLVAALLRTVLAVLDEQQSFAIIATHSPVVLQEVPSSSVLVLRRSFDELSIEQPEIETFGENVGLLTRNVFSLDNRETDFEGVLERLARRYSIDEIDGMFRLGLSAQARSLILSIQRSREMLRPT